MATLQTTTVTRRQRSTQATQRLKSALELEGIIDLTALATALAEVASDEIMRNPTFAAALTHHYEEIVALRSRGGRKSSKPSREPLVAIRHTGERVDPFSPPDPEKLKFVYGEDKLARALDEYTLDMLKLTASRIEATHPGTKPRNRGHRDAVIAYIVEHSQ